MTIVFWGLYSIDPGNVGNSPPMYPIINHIVHTSVGIAVLIEILLTYHRRPARDKSLIILVGFFSIFTCWLFFVHYKTNFWLYPIFGKLSPVPRALFIVGALILFLSLYCLGSFLHRKAWSKDRVIAYFGSIKAANEMNIDLVNYKNQDRVTSP